MRYTYSRCQPNVKAVIYIPGGIILKDIQVTINPTEIRSLQYNNAFSKKPGERIQLSVKSEASIKLNPTNPVIAIVGVKVTVEDPDKCIQMEIETITGVTVSTFVDNLDQYIKERYLPVILMSANEKIRSVSAIVGTPIKIPNPRFGNAAPESAGPEGLTQ